MAQEINNDINPWYNIMCLIVLFILFMLLSLTSCTTQRHMVTRADTLIVTVHDTLRESKVIVKNDTLREIHNIHTVVNQKGDTVRQVINNNIYRNSETKDSSDYYKALWYASLDREYGDDIIVEKEEHNQYINYVILFVGILVGAGVMRLFK